MSFPNKPPKPPKVKIVVPDDSGTVVSEEMQLDLRTRDDLDRIMWSLTALLEGGKGATKSELQPVNVDEFGERHLHKLPAPRRELLRTALDLLRLRNLSVSYVPGVLGEPKVYSVLLALYTMEGFDTAITITRLQRSTQIPNSTLLRLIEKMVRDGLIDRTASNHDARHVLVGLTTRARDMLDCFFRAAGEALRKG